MPRPGALPEAEESAVALRDPKMDEFARQLARDPDAIAAGQFVGVDEVTAVQWANDARIQKAVKQYHVARGNFFGLARSEGVALLADDGTPKSVKATLINTALRHEEARAVTTLLDRLSSPAQGMAPGDLIREADRIRGRAEPIDAEYQEIPTSSETPSPPALSSPDPSAAAS